MDTDAATSGMYTPELAAESEVTIKKSRFIGLAFPILSVEDAEARLAEVREIHSGANHHCFAYSVGSPVPTERFSDAGEPSGTAGRPILEVLRRRHVRDTLIVVVRYFGGVLLGANGLTRAYAQSAAQVLDDSVLLRMDSMSQIRVECDYGALGKLEYELTQAGYELYDKEFTDKVSFAIWVEADKAASMTDALANWSNGRMSAEVGEATLVGVRPDGTLRLP